VCPKGVDYTAFAGLSILYWKIWRQLQEPPISKTYGVSFNLRYLEAQNKEFPDLQYCSAMIEKNEKRKKV
jgi:hypothetical protein